MLYRRGTEKDIPEIVRKRIEYLQEHHNGLSSSYVAHLGPKLTNYFHQHLDHNIIAYVAVDTEPFVVATTLLLIVEKPARPSFMNGKTGTVLNVYTDPAFRRLGISEMLMKMLMTDAEKMGLDYVDLTATTDGYPLYKKLGFEDEVMQTKPMKFHFRKDF